MFISVLAARPPASLPAAEATATPRTAAPLSQAQSAQAVSFERQFATPRARFMEVSPSGDKLMPELAEPLAVEAQPGLGGAPVQGPDSPNSEGFGSCGPGGGEEASGAGEGLSSLETASSSR
jgi:hypothetical protein